MKDLRKYIRWIDAQKFADPKVAAHAYWCKLTASALMLNKGNAPALNYLLPEATKDFTKLERMIAA